MTDLEGAISMRCYISYLEASILMATLISPEFVLLRVPGSLVLCCKKLCVLAIVFLCQDEEGGEHAMTGATARSGLLLYRVLIVWTEMKSELGTEERPLNEEVSGVTSWNTRHVGSNRLAELLVPRGASRTPIFTCPSR